MKNTLFKNVPIPTPSKSSFDLSHEVKLTGKIGRLIPIYWQDCVPGDSFRIKNEVLVKFAPILAPILHRVDVFTHSFFVPYRLLMNDTQGSAAGWEGFITGDPEGNYVTEELPYITISNANKAYFVPGTLNDYLGLPVIENTTTVTQDIDINCLPHYAYHFIYNEYYRDQNLISKVTSASTGAGGDIHLIGGDQNGKIMDICSLRVRAYEKDYFKGALPTAYFTAGGDVELDLDWSGGLGATRVHNANTGAALVVGSPTSIDVDANGRMEVAGQDVFLTSSSSTVDYPVATLEILELRRAQALTRFLEAENRGGHRYKEMLLGVWGVNSQDARLDRPEYIGGGRQAVQVSTVLNQSSTLDPTAGVNDGAGGVPVTIDPQSLETGRALSVGQNNRAQVNVKEHGIIMTIMSVLPRTAYGGARIEKFWRKADRTDFFVPQLQGIGDQEILQSEIGYDATGTDADNVFGYAPRWSEYKFKDSTVHGEFLTTLDYWHMAEIGDTSGAGPDLNQAFIECNNTDDNNERIFAVTGGQTLYCQIYNEVKAIRPIRS